MYLTFQLRREQKSAHLFQKAQEVESPLDGDIWKDEGASHREDDQCS